MPRQVYLPLFLSVGLFLTFLTYRGWSRPDKAKDAGGPTTPTSWTGRSPLVSLVPALYIVSDWQGFFRRAVLPTDMDLIIGTGWSCSSWRPPGGRSGSSCPLVVVGFLLTAYFGSEPAPSRSRRRTSRGPG